MANGRLNLHWVLRSLCALLMVETGSGTSGPSPWAHTSPQLPASGVNQTLDVDVSIQEGSRHHQVGV